MQKNQEFKALGDRIWVDPIYPPKTNAAGNIYLMYDNDYAYKGRVVAIGNECDEIALGNLKIGDVVYWDEGFHASMQEINGKEYLYLYQQNILYYETEND